MGQFKTGCRLEMKKDSNYLIINRIRQFLKRKKIHNYIHNNSLTLEGWHSAFLFIGNGNCKNRA